MNGWLGAALVLLVLNGVLIYQNQMLRGRSAAIEKAAHGADLERGEVDLLAASAQLVGTCVPRAEEPLQSESAEPALRPLRLQLYFSLASDCISCVQAEVEKLHSLLEYADQRGVALQVEGFANIGDPLARRTLDRDLRPAFPVSHVGDVRGALASMGLSGTPVLVLLDEASGRALGAHFPARFDKRDRRFIDRVQQLLEPCA
ncbi:MAG: hypothetical protein AAF604_07595 [Acidobacteriota bacterium]